MTIRYNTLPMGANDYLEIVYYSTGKRVGKEALRDQWRLALERGVFGFRIFANDEDYKKDEVSVDCRLDGGDVRGCPIDLADYPCLELEC